VKRFLIIALIIVFVASCATLQPQDTSTSTQPADDKQNLPKAIQGDIFVERAVAGEVEDASTTPATTTNEGKESDIDLMKAGDSLLKGALWVIDAVLTGASYW
jgi:hypothetical protein